MVMNNTAKYKFLTYLFLLLSIFVVLLFSKDFYLNILENNKQRDILTQKLAEKTSEYNKLANIKSDIETWKVKDINFDKFLSKFSEDELVQYFYSYVTLNPTKLRIESISFDEWLLNEFWFKEWKIELNATFSTEKDMIDTISYLINSEKYNLYVHEFNYPYGTTTGQFSATIPLKVLYK